MPAKFAYFERLRRGIVDTCTTPDDDVLVVSSDPEELAALCADGVRSSMSYEADSHATPGRRHRTVVASKLLEQVHDVVQCIDDMKDHLEPDGRLVVIGYNRAWQPIVRLLDRLGLRRSRDTENWIPRSEIQNLLEQRGFEVVRTSHHVLMPVRIPLVSDLVNRWAAPLPVIRTFCAVVCVVARVAETRRHPVDPSVSIVIAARNEAGNIAPLLDRIPQLSPDQEIVIVEGGSKDETWAVIEDEATRRNGRPGSSRIVGLQQTGTGKGDAVRLGFEHATGDILIILDADISVPPEELRHFVHVLVSGKCDFANGSRLVYSMDDRAMQFLNLLGNRMFGALFTFLIGQPIRDTLCGTKALWRSDYERIAANRDFFGDFDPFGDFDLLFGAARLNMRIRDVPVHYMARVYGSTNISRFRHGVLLLKMSWLAARKLKFTSVLPA